MSEKVVLELIAVNVMLISILGFVLKSILTKSSNRFKNNDLPHIRDQIEKILAGCGICQERIGRLDERVKSAEQDIKELFRRNGKP